MGNRLYTKNKNEVIVREIKHPNHFTRLSSQSLKRTGTKLPIAAADVVEPAASTRNNDAVKRMESHIKTQDMVVNMPYPPPSFNDEPFIPAFGAKLRDPRYNNKTDTVGALDLDNDKAYVRTLGEVIERFYQMYPTDESQLTFDRYSRLKDKALDPVLLFPFETLDPGINEMDFNWIFAGRYGTKEKKLLPSRLIFLYHDDYNVFLDSIRTTNGTAFGYYYGEAVFSGFCEVLERDAFLMNYLTKATPPRIDISTFANNKIDRLIEYFSRYNLEINLFNITLEFEPIVAMAIILDRSGIGPSIGIGTACGLDHERIVLKAILEAQQIRLFSRRAKLDEEESTLDDPMKERALMWFGTENIEKIDFFLKSDKYIQIKEIQKEKEEILKEFPHGIFVCDLSLNGIGDWKVVKVIIPECLPLYFDDNYIPTNIMRLKKYQGDRELNLIPHPFI